MDIGLIVRPGDIRRERNGMSNRKRYSGVSALLLAATLLTACGGPADMATGQMASNTAGGTEAMSDGIVIHTSVRTTGQFPESIVRPVPAGVDLSELDLSEADFHMTGTTGMWGSDDTREFSCEFEKLENDGNTIVLYPKNFPEKYFYVQNFVVSCDKDDALSFTDQDVEKVDTRVADDFQTFTKENGAAFDYELYTPETEEKMPVVVVFHGYGDTENLRTYRTAVEWAEPENQEIRPCYVIAPVIDDNTYYSARNTVFTPLKALLDQMVEEGKADPDRIYVMGNSFGGMSSIEFAELYPDAVAGILALCPALNYSTTAMAQLEKIKEIPIWFAQAEHDNTISIENSRKAVDQLEKLGAKEVKFTEYTDDEMNAAGADASPDSTYSYHHVELAVMEDDAFMDWLYAQKKE